MTIENRIAEAEQKFEQLKSQRDELLRQAEELLTEMTKLQGEYRVLIELKNDTTLSEPQVKVKEKKR